MSEPIEGRNAVLEALRSGMPLREVLVASGVQPDAQVERVLALAGEAGVSVRHPERRELDRLSSRGAHQGVVAIAEPFPYVSIDEIVRRATDMTASLVVALDHITDTGNLGAIARSAEVCGADGLVIETRRSAQVGVGAYKTSAGAVAHLPIAREPNLVRALERLKEAGYWVAGASEHSDTEVWDAPMEGRIALVLGSEGEGLGRLTEKTCDFLVSLPVRGRVGSLNVAQAGTALMYEWVRRCR